MKRIHYLLLGLAISCCIAAVSPTLPPTRIIAGNSTITVVTNGLNNFTLTASGGVGTLSSFATNLSVIGLGTGSTTNNPLSIYGTNGVKKAYFDKDAVLQVEATYPVNAIVLRGTSVNDPALSIRSGGYGDFLIGTLGSLNGMTLGSDGGTTMRVGLPVTASVTWTSDTSPISAVTTRLKNVSAGLLSVDNGVDGTYRDFATRSLYSTNVYATNVVAGGYIATGVQSLSGAGAVNVTTGITEVTTTGAAQALTLADGVAGQEKTIIHGVAGGSAVLTPTTKTGFTTVTFTGVGESVTLVYLTTRGWIVKGSYLAVIAP